MRKPVTVRANRDELRVLHEGREVARHVRCHDAESVARAARTPPGGARAAPTSRGPTRWHRSSTPGGRRPASSTCSFASRPVKTGIHLRRLLALARVYGRTEVLAAIARAVELKTYDAAYVENLLMAERRRRQLPTPTLPTPETARTDRRDRTRSRRPGFLRPFLSRHRGGL